jgi:hypothetical protein
MKKCFKMNGTIPTIVGNSGISGINHQRKLLESKVYQWWETTLIDCLITLHHYQVVNSLGHGQGQFCSQTTPLSHHSAPWDSPDGPSSSLPTAQRRSPAGGGSGTAQCPG